MKYFALALAVTLSASTANSQTLKTLVEFTGRGGAASGFDPQGDLTVSGTTLYGMTLNGGTGTGNLFSVGEDGTNFQSPISFDSPPPGSLTLSGTTLYGTSGDTIFSVSTNLSNFQNLGSESTQGAFALSGTTLFGNDGTDIFSVGTDGSNLQIVFSYPGNNGNFATTPGGLTLSGSTFYGMTENGGPSGLGNVFSVGMDGTNYNSLLSFAGTSNGASPFGSLTLCGTTLYGMTSRGGANSDGAIFSVGIDGNNYKSMHSFGGADDGMYPAGGLTLSGTTLYGMTSISGNEAGTLFSISIDGSDYQNLYTFTGGSDGGYPVGDLTLSGGTLFGMTPVGGTNGYGTIFAMDLTPTPEPGSLALVGTAAVAAIAYRWRRMRSRRKNRR